MFAAGCAGDARNEVDAAEPAADLSVGVLKMAVVGSISPDPTMLNPANELDVLAADLLFDGLTRFDAATRTVVPAVATAWRTTDGVSWTFDLDPARTFTDGSLLTADDVVRSITEVVTRRATLGAGMLDVIVGYKEFTTGTAKTISGLSAADATHVTIRLAAPNYELPALLADPTYGITPSDAPVSMIAGLVGSGPFKLDSVDESTTVLTAVTGTDTSVDSIELHAYADEGAGLTALAEGEVQLAGLGDGADVPPGASSYLVSSATLGLAVSATNGRWSDPAAHQALVAAIDRAGVAAATTGEEARVADDLVPGGFGAVAACAKACAATDAAKAELKRLKASKPVVHLDVLDRAEAKAAAAELERQLEAVGFRVEVRAGSGDALESRLTSGQLELMLYVVAGLAPSPDPYLSGALGSRGTGNVTGFQSAKFDAAIAKARSTKDLPKRLGTYLEAEELALGTAPILPLVQLGHRYAASTRVTGMLPAAGILFDGRTIAVAAG